MFQTLCEQKCIWEKRIAYSMAEKNWNRQFPLLSCHPPFVSPEDYEKLEIIMERRKRRHNNTKKLYASEI